jgi:hypothetical protein
MSDTTRPTLPHENIVQWLAERYEMDGVAVRLADLLGALGGHD